MAKVHRGPTLPWIAMVFIVMGIIVGAYIAAENLEHLQWVYEIGK